MEGQVTLSLQEYTNMVVELNRLKDEVKGFKRKAYARIESLIKDGLIDNIQEKEKIITFITSESTENLVNKFANCYSWDWRNISDEIFNIISEEELKEICASEIKRKLNDRLKEIIEEEKAKNEGE